MDETRFGLRELPFRPIPGVDCYYPATTHEQASAQILEAIEADEGLTLLIGEPGTGKTTVCLRLLQQVGEQHTRAFITHGHFATSKDLLQAVLYDIGLAYQDRSEEELRLLLTDLAIKNYEAGKRTILFFDEAQHLTCHLLEELRLMTNLDGNRGKAIQVVLTAQPSVMETLRRPELAAFNQRLAVRARLEPLGVHEASDYLAHHLRAASTPNRAILTDEAMALLARGTHGVPRLLNRAARRALELAATSEANEVDAEAAMEALAVLGLGDTDGGDAEPDGELNLADKDGENGEAIETTPPGWEQTAKKESAAVSDIAKEVSRARRLFAPPRRPA
jgi:general secretion pathway protein A